MVREEPFFKKCCGCVPLKTCLQVWSCLKSVADISLLVFLVILIAILFQYHEFKYGLSWAHSLILFLVILIIDCVFMLVLTVGLWTKNLRVLKVYFYYCLYMVSVSGVTFLLFSIFGFMEIWQEGYEELYIIVTILLLINFALDICIIFTLKSEMIKLRNKQQYGFVKMSSLVQEEGLSEPEPFQADEIGVPA